MSPTQRTLAECRARGWTVAVVERWNPHARIRQDLFGFIDLLAIREDGHLLAIQACAGPSHAARRTKIEAAPLLAAWLSSPARSVEVWSWAKRGPRGKHKVWTLRTEELKSCTPAADKNTA